LRARFIRNSPNRSKLCIKSLALALPNVFSK
jgi:hypothetical protein